MALVEPGSRCLAAVYIRAGARRRLDAVDYPCANAVDMDLAIFGPGIVHAHYLD